eukprot:TRINITY_DN17_c0_g2_i1.p1 TRINITY_DN17_c0_g2~~TRINITY_DN17_c0_g2_i1.p1  ORF type:complete len:109 (+),score=23.27 TRINITY_DN17_c0_g2_i1:24-329(+)
MSEEAKAPTEAPAPAVATDAAAPAATPAADPAAAAPAAAGADAGGKYGNLQPKKPSLFAKRLLKGKQPARFDSADWAMDQGGGGKGPLGRGKPGPKAANLK